MDSSTQLSWPDIAPPPLRPGLRDEWMLDERIAFLNHGSFGATPRRVFQEQDAWRRRIESEPVEIIGRRHESLLARSRQAIGDWLNMRPADFGFVTNATEGVNAVLRSLRLEPGQELLTTTHVYNAVRQAMRSVADRSGATYREIDVPPPFQSPDQIAERILGGLGPRTRFLLIDHVTSPTAVIFPVREIVSACAERGIDVMVDGAHGPGMLPLDVSAIGAAYYAGNLHKWACAPKGTGFLWVRPDRQADVHPPIISHRYGDGFAAEFSWQGTRDLAAWLAAPAALEFLGEIGWQAVRGFNHAMITAAQRMLCERWGVEPISPLNGSMIGSMATIPLPGKLSRLTEAEFRSTQQRLYSEFQVEVPIMQWGGRSYVRPCCQIYNRPEDFDRLAAAVPRL